MSVVDSAFVLDASIAACWCLNDETNPRAEAALLGIAKHGAVVPALFWFELRNVLLMAERRQRVSDAQTARSLSYISEFNIRIDREPVETMTMCVARHPKLSVYDAPYLKLELRQILPLATLDGSLIKAARTEGVALFE